MSICFTLGFPCYDAHRAPGASAGRITVPTTAQAYRHSSYLYILIMLLGTDRRPYIWNGILLHRLAKTANNITDFSISSRVSAVKVSVVRDLSVTPLLGPTQFTRCRVGRPASCIIYTLSCAFLTGLAMPMRGRITAYLALLHVVIIVHGGAKYTTMYNYGA